VLKLSEKIGIRKVDDECYLVIAYSYDPQAFKQFKIIDKAYALSEENAVKIAKRFLNRKKVFEVEIYRLVFRYYKGLEV
jgi:hypothetical protein